MVEVNKCTWIDRGGGGVSTCVLKTQSILFVREFLPPANKVAGGLCFHLCLSVTLSTVSVGVGGGARRVVVPMWPLPMMHWTSLYSPLPLVLTSGNGRRSTYSLQVGSTHPTGIGYFMKSQPPVPISSIFPIQHLLPSANEVAERQCFYTCLSAIMFAGGGGFCLSACWDTPP